MKEQKKPSSENKSTAPINRLGHLISLLERLLRQELSAVLAPMNLTLQQYSALQILNNNDQISNAKLAKLSFMTPPSTTEMVSALEAKALVVRQPSASHGRIIYIQISREGKHILRKADAAVLKTEKRMLASIPMDDRPKLRDQLIGCIGGLRPAIHQEFPLRSEAKP